MERVIVFRQDGKSHYIRFGENAGVFNVGSRDRIQFQGEEFRECKVKKNAISRNINSKISKKANSKLDRLKTKITKNSLAFFPAKK
jgi:hypothetical protein